MANVRHAAKLQEGAPAWNAWRAESPGVAPDLSDLKLPAGARRYGPDEGGPIDLRGANLRRAVLAGADLGNARLGDADLSGADLSGANLGQADLTGARLAGADLSGAWLGDARGLTQAQINRAYGHATTVLPDHLAVPPGWLGEEAAAPRPEEAADPGTDKADSRADQGADPGAGKEAGNGASRGGKPAGGGTAEEDPYGVLGVGRKASQSEIRAAYLRLAKELHPDGRPPGAEARWQCRAVQADQRCLPETEGSRPTGEHRQGRAPAPRGRGVRGGRHDCHGAARRCRALRRVVARDAEPAHNGGRGGPDRGRGSRRARQRGGQDRGRHGGHLRARQGDG